MTNPLIKINDLIDQNPNQADIPFESIGDSIANFVHSLDEIEPVKKRSVLIESISDIKSFVSNKNIKNHSKWKSFIKDLSAKIIEENRVGEIFLEKNQSFDSLFVDLLQNIKIIDVSVAKQKSSRNEKFEEYKEQVSLLIKNGFRKKIRFASSDSVESINDETIKLLIELYFKYISSQHEEFEIQKTEQFNKFVDYVYFKINELENENLESGKQGTLLDTVNECVESFILEKIEQARGSSTFEAALLKINNYFFENNEIRISNREEIKRKISKSLCFFVLRGCFEQLEFALNDYIQRNVSVQIESEILPILGDLECFESDRREMFDKIDSSLMYFSDTILSNFDLDMKISLIQANHRREVIYDQLFFNFLKSRTLIKKQLFDQVNGYKKVKIKIDLLKEKYSEEQYRQDLSNLEFYLLAAVELLEREIVETCLLEFEYLSLDQYGEIGEDLRNELNKKNLDCAKEMCDLFLDFLEDLRNQRNSQNIQSLQNNHLNLSNRFNKSVSNQKKVNDKFEKNLDRFNEKINLITDFYKIEAPTDLIDFVILSIPKNMIDANFVLNIDTEIEDSIKDIIKSGVLNYLKDRNLTSKINEIKSLNEVNEELDQYHESLKDLNKDFALKLITGFSDSSVLSFLGILKVSNESTSLISSFKKDISKIDESIKNKIKNIIVSIISEAYEKAVYDSIRNV